MSDEKSFVQREKRFEVGDLNGFDAIIRRENSDENLYYAELIDFSKSGVKFGLPFNAKFDEVLSVRFQFKNCELEYSGTIRVRHIRNIEKSRWHVGCSIEPPLPDDVISLLASKSKQERRRYPRVDVESFGRMISQGSIEEYSAKIISISEGGFCVVVDVPHENGQRVDLLVDNREGNQENIAARVHWQKEVDGAYEMGCSFTNEASYTKLVECLTISSDSESSDGVNWLVAAAAMLAIFLPPVAYLLMDSNNHEANAATVSRQETAEYSNEPFGTAPELATGESIDLVPVADASPFELSGGIEHQFDDSAPEQSANTAGSTPDSEAKKVILEDVKPVIASTSQSDAAAGMLAGRLPVAEPLNQPPAELTNAPRQPRPRRSMSNRGKSNLLPQPFQLEEEPIKKSNILVVANLKLKTRKSDEASSRRRNGTRNPIVPSEVIRKRLLGE